MIVNNAAITDASQTKVADVSSEMVNKILAVNFMAPFILAQEALPHIRKVKGNIVFINSATGKDKFV